MTPEERRLRFDWAVLRLVPRVHREEFCNVGILLHVPTERLLLLRILTEKELHSRLDGWAVQGRAIEHLAAIRKICSGAENGGPIAKLSSSERFHWLTAPRSAVVQTSTVRIGLTRNPERTLEGLFNEQCG